MQIFHLNRICQRLIFLFVILSHNVQAIELPPLSHQLSRLQHPIAAPALALALLNTNDATMSLDEQMGSVVVVNFWASWCLPCRREMGALERFYQSTSGRGVRVLAVNIGEHKDTVSQYMETLQPELTFPVLLDPESQTAAAWEVKGLPTTYIIDGDGMLIYKALGGRQFDHPDILQSVNNLTRKPH